MFLARALKKLKMNIDENIINNNALRLINFAITSVVDEENPDGYMLGAFNYIKGICDMADAMKKVLKELVRCEM
jgi:hypothetical protein